MSKLSIFQSDSSDRYESSIFETVNGEEIAERLSAKGVRFERWPLKTLACAGSMCHQLAAKCLLISSPKGHHQLLRSSKQCLVRSLTGAGLFGKIMC